jgi:hypothetical protein
MQARIQLVTILGAALLLLAVLELVRRRRLTERYALLWLLSAVVLLTLAIWAGALARISHAIGVIYPPNALFFMAIGCIALLLLHFSAVVSRLSDQVETLAQRQALLEERVSRLEQPSGALASQHRAHASPARARPRAPASSESQRSPASRETRA